MTVYNVLGKCIQVYTIMNSVYGCLLKVYQGIFHVSRPPPLLSSVLALQRNPQAISYCPRWDKQVSSNESLAPGSLCPWPAGEATDLSLR